MTLILKLQVIYLNGRSGQEAYLCTLQDTFSTSSLMLGIYPLNWPINVTGSKIPGSSVFTTTWWRMVDGVMDSEIVYWARRKQICKIHKSFVRLSQFKTSWSFSTSFLMFKYLCDDILRLAFSETRCCVADWKAPESIVSLHSSYATMDGL